MAVEASRMRRTESASWASRHLLLLIFRTRNDLADIRAACLVGVGDLKYTLGGDEFEYVRGHQDLAALIMDSGDQLLLL